ncbi:glycosyltransferase family 4 protein [Sphingomonas piscis]|nr:glycosyltransferase family 4 protein [Sphingomonas piscis]
MAVASELARLGHEVTLIGSGDCRSDIPYRYLRAPLIPRERFERIPSLPVFRSETAWEEATFLAGFLKIYRPQQYDVTLTCSYPFLNWALRARKFKGTRPAHVFVTQNGDWPARSQRSEFRYFDCDGLICINPDYYRHNQSRYEVALIPNGVDLTKFHPGADSRAQFCLPSGVPIVLMVSALIESKMVETGIRAVSSMSDVHLVVAGDGPLREQLRAKAEAIMPGRYHNFTVAADRMPELYRSVNVFLHLSRDESFGNVFVEAMASGVTTVAWDLERTRWITGETAMLSPDGDEAALIGQLIEAIEHPKSKDVITRRALQFSWTSIAQQYREFLNVVTGKHMGVDE